MISVFHFHKNSIKLKTKHPSAEGGTFPNDSIQKILPEIIEFMLRIL